MAFEAVGVVAVNASFDRDSSSESRFNVSDVLPGWFYVSATLYLACIFSLGFLVLLSR